MSASVIGALVGLLAAATFYLFISVIVGRTGENRMLRTVLLADFVILPALGYWWAGMAFGDAQ